ncbi:cell division protein ZapE [Paraburkholderia sp. 22099]|jgi:cell division protein ZapE|uniref:Cell division protein ZapE n=1 Tax=Paraburkholderia terricola TaxID=169427 RepID=A0A1M6R379_9BURK|nr:MULTISPECIES: cell division protein ZapE [Paraburkholderia]ORC49858.1 cell division protein ZapE [Burkholderia sp. A27]AXE92803.1 cell division protein ZapE [Paraburkholderia terricola]MDR6410445.1 cell division protein ZapE [Paraburkholderia terricola]MDR6447147.1 cell division protein ZapE [Paraburkholderia terricola]MDR6484707.1 cell division protein ZapE [Paraburkholderia terricola]
MNVTEYYEKELQTRGYQSDPAQRAAVDRLQRCYEEWVEYKSRRSNAFKKLIIHPDRPRGVYMWGGVGRGKSFLMDSFYMIVPVQRKTRLHFHEFMREVHRELEELKGRADPLDELALRIAKRYRLICFDEFHVSDIADAMILYRLLDKLFENGVQFVMTSNYAPDTLYPDGLHRDRMLPAIELIKEKVDVINVDAGVDYRQRTLAQVEVYHTPLGAAADKALRDAFARLAAVPDESPILHIEKRELKALRRADGVVWFDFATLCGGPRSQNDYLELASRFHAVILSGVPQMSARMASEARRFTWLIDVFYDHKVKLLMSAAVPAEQLYVDGPMANEFTRTVSRIVEMQSKEYLDAPRRIVDTSLT